MVVVMVLPLLQGCRQARVLGQKQLSSAPSLPKDQDSISVWTTSGQLTLSSTGTMHIYNVFAVPRRLWLHRHVLFFLGRRYVTGGV